MSRRYISQREAHALAKRVTKLESERDAQRTRWAQSYPGGVSLGMVTRDRDWLSGRMEAARFLGHAVVATTGNDGNIQFYALPLPKE